MSYTCKDFGDQPCDGCQHNPLGVELPVECGNEWNDGKDHKCAKPKNHIGGCICSCEVGRTNRAQRRAARFAKRGRR